MSNDQNAIDQNAMGVPFFMAEDFQGVSHENRQPHLNIIQEFPETSYWFIGNSWGGTPDLGV